MEQTHAGALYVVLPENPFIACILPGVPERACSREPYLVINQRVSVLMPEVYVKAGFHFVYTTLDQIIPERSPQ